jgi:Hypervirulence associated proteins TUDOR domain
MSRAFKVDDRVTWNTPQGETHGHVTRVISSHTTVDGHTVDASPSEPQYQVQSEKSGKHAVHRAGALKHR